MANILTYMFFASGVGFLIAFLAMAAIPRPIDSPTKEKVSNFLMSLTLKFLLPLTITSFIGLMLNLIFGPFKGPKDLLQLKDSKHNFGVVLSLIGLWLGGSGVLGKENLNRWDQNMKKWIDEKRREDAVLSTWYKSILSPILKYWYVIAVITLGLVAYSLYTTEPALSPSQLIVSVFAFVVMFSVGALPIILAFLVSFPLLLSSLISFMELPYRIVSAVERKDALERTLMFLGLVFGSIGIFLLEY